MKYDEKATVSIDANGAVLKCAKGADANSCGFKAGADICAKCGAMPVEMKMVPVDYQGKGLDLGEPDETDYTQEPIDGMDEEDMPVKPKKKKMPKPEMDEDMVDAEDMEDEDDMKADPMEDEDVSQMDDAPEMMPKKKKPLPAQAMPMGAKKPADMVDEDMVDDEDMPEDDEESEKMMPKWKKRRMNTMGMGVNCSENFSAQEGEQCRASTVTPPTRP